MKLFLFYSLISTVISFNIAAMEKDKEQWIELKTFNVHPQQHISNSEIENHDGTAFYVKLKDAIAEYIKLPSVDPEEINNVTTHFNSIKEILSDNKNVNHHNLLIQDAFPLIDSLSHSFTSLQSWGHVQMADLVKLILENVAFPDEQFHNNAFPKKYSGCNTTALHKAAALHHSKILSLLLEKSTTNINTQNYWEETPLHYAIGVGCQKNTQLLLDKGASCTIVDKYGNTPLHITILKLITTNEKSYYYTPYKKDHPEIIKLLLKYNPPLSITNHDGKTSLDLLEETTSKEETDYKNIINNLIQEIKKRNIR